MNKKDLIKLINEEISNFDFLGNEENLEEQEIIDLLNNEDLQKQFICDSLLKKTNKIKLNILDAQLWNDWEKDGYIKLEYNIEVTYIYDPVKEPLKFDLSFTGEHISYSIDNYYVPGDQYTAPDDRSWFDDFGWDDVNVNIYTSDGDDIEFKSFNNAPSRIQHIFIRDYIGKFISEEALGMNTPVDKDSVEKTGWC